MRISFKFATIITIIISIFQLSTGCGGGDRLDTYLRSEEHKSELQSRSNISYAGFCL